MNDNRRNGSQYVTRYRIYITKLDLFYTCYESLFACHF